MENFLLAVKGAKVLRFCQNSTGALKILLLRRVCTVDILDFR
jgi:hypothetical protein